MPSLWKKIKKKLGRKKKTKTDAEDLGDIDLMQPMSGRMTAHSVRMEDTNWRPAISGTSWNDQIYHQSPSPLRQEVPVRNPLIHHNTEDYNYDPQDAFSTMEGLIHPEDDPAFKSLPEPPQSRSRSRSRSRSGHSAQHQDPDPETQNPSPDRDMKIHSINSLSTITGPAPPPDVGSIVDEQVRRSLATKSVSSPRGLGRSFTSATAHRVNVIPVGVVTRTSAPLHKYQSMMASPQNLRENTISYVSTASVPPLPQSALPVQMEEPPSEPYHQSPEATRLSEQLGLDIIGASKVSLVGSPKESLKSLSPKPLSPMPYYPAPAAFIFEQPQPFRVVEAVTAIVPPDPPLGSIRSHTYQHALKNPVPMPDPLPTRTRKVHLQRVTTAPPPQPYTYMSTVRLEDSKGKALTDARQALYGTRPASERFYWTLPPEHDIRVLAMLTWIHRMRWALANFAVQKFLETKQRGALLINVNYRAGTRSLTTPAVDWMTLSESHRTLDRVLQENIATYKPAETALVFAFLVSKSKNSVGMWLKKLAVPETIRQEKHEQIDAVKAGINPDDLLVHVEATPDSPPGTRTYQAPRAPIPRHKRPPEPPLLVESIRFEAPVPVPVFVPARPQSQPPPQTFAPAPVPYSPSQPLQPTKTLYQSQQQTHLVRNDTIKLVPSEPAPEPESVPAPVTITGPRHPSLPRASASTIVGSRIHVFGDDPDFDRRRHTHQVQPTVAPIPEMSPSFSSQSDRTTLSGRDTGAPVPLEIEVVQPVKKPSRWKRLFGLGGKKRGKPAEVVIKTGKGKLEKKKKSLVEWD